MSARRAFLIAFLPVLAAASCRLRTAEQSASDAGTESDSPVVVGELAVAQRNCAQCHQSPDPADGILSGQTTPVPGTHSYGSNLTPDPDTGMDAWSTDAIVAALTQGMGPVGPQGNTLCPSMPAYSDMTPDEASAIAAYLQSLTPVWHPVPASVCPPCEPPPESGIPVPRSACEDDASAAGDGSDDANPE
jgi:mono/diheme cytochrome c family protein